jgi:hypothetical protein
MELKVGYSLPRKDLSGSFKKALLLPSPTQTVTPQKEEKVIAPGSFLSSLGLEADKEVIESYSTSSGEGKKKVPFVGKSKLKAVILLREKGSGIAFCCESKWHDSGSWANKCFCDHVMLPEKWTEELNFIPTKCFHWFHKNLPMCDAKGYNVNIYIVCFHGMILETVALEIGKEVVKQVNKHPENACLGLDKDVYFWLLGANCWSDILGMDQAYKYMLEQKGDPGVGYYAKNKKFIDSIFCYCSYDNLLRETLDT